VNKGDEEKKKKLEEECLLWAIVENCSLKGEGRIEVRKEKNIQGRGLPLAQGRVSAQISTYETKM